MTARTPARPASDAALTAGTGALLFDTRRLRLKQYKDPVTGTALLGAGSILLVGGFVGIGLGFVALTVSGRPATPQKTYGFHRVEILAALANGVLLVLLGVGVPGDPEEVVLLDDHPAEPFPGTGLGTSARLAGDLPVFHHFWIPVPMKMRKVKRREDDSRLLARWFPSALNSPRVASMSAETPALNFDENFCIK